MTKTIIINRGRKFLVIDHQNGEGPIVFGRSSSGKWSLGYVSTEDGRAIKLAHSEGRTYCHAS